MDTTTPHRGAACNIPIVVSRQALPWNMVIYQSFTYLPAVHNNSKRCMQWVLRQMEARAGTTCDYDAGSPPKVSRCLAEVLLGTQQLGNRLTRCMHRRKFPSQECLGAKGQICQLAGLLSLVVFFGGGGNRDKECTVPKGMNSGGLYLNITYSEFGSFAATEIRPITWNLDSALDLECICLNVRS